MDKKIKSSILASLAAITCLFSKVSDSSLKELAKPHLGLYECKQATLGEKDYLQVVDELVLELRAQDDFLLYYKEKGGERKQIKGKYQYDEKRGVLTLCNDKGVYKREFPFIDGKLTVTFPVGNKTMLLKFTRK